MCTVSLAPLPGGGLVITSNRDERTDRHGAPPTVRSLGGVNVLAPTDALTGTTWIAAAANDRMACLLNGADGPMHFAERPSRSRGTVVLEAITTGDFFGFLSGSDLVDVHPFTLLCTKGSGTWMLQWTGSERTLEEIDPLVPRLWSSTTLFGPAVRAVRDDHFQRLHKNAGFPGLEELWAFHATPHLDDARQALIMQRDGGLRTVSITQVTRTPEGFMRMRFSDLLAGTEHAATLPGLQRITPGEQ